MPHLIPMLAFVVATAAALVYVTHRLGQSPILAYLLTGILLGPGVLNLFPDAALFSQLGEIGVIFLLFFVGLEFHLDALRRFTRLALAGGGLQIGLTGGLVAGIARLFGLSLHEALLVGVMIALSSTALVVKVFEDRDESDSAAAQGSMALLITQDLAAMLAMAALPLLLPNQPASYAVRQVLTLLVMLPVLMLIYRLFLPRILRAVVHTRQGELFALTALAVCLAVAAAAEEVGASLALGAFLGGVILCETPVAYQIRGDLAPFKHLTLALFFIWVGMLLDFEIIGRYALPITGALIGVLLFKILTTAAALRLIGETGDFALRIGITLCQVGEFSFILAQVASQKALISPAIYQGILTVTLLSMALTPTLITHSQRWAQALSRLIGVNPVEGTSPVEPGPARAVVIGYGPIGAQLTEVLEAAGIETAVVELNLDTVNRLRTQGRTVIYGDAARREVLASAGLAEAGLLVVTLPDLMSRMAVIPTALSLNPQLRIYVRARYLREQPMLQELGAEYVAYEEREVTFELARQVLEDLSVSREAAQRLLERIRQQSP